MKFTGLPLGKKHRIMERKILLSLIFGFLILSCTSHPTFCASPNYKVLLFDETITVLDSKTAQISLNYKFMPLLKEGYYFDTWYMPLNTENASEIIVRDEYGPLNFNTSVYADWTNLAITLRNQVYANQSYLLKISYLAKDIIETIGPEKDLKMWTATDSVYKENVTLTVNIPRSYEVIKYEPLFLSNKKGANDTVLSGQMLGVNSDTEYYLNVELADTIAEYDVTQTYTFVNKGSATESAPQFELPGPLESERQEVTQIRYSPSPSSTYYDESGNLRVLFKTSPIAPGGNVNITVSYVAKITLSPAINNSFSGGLSDIPLEYRKYTSTDNYWEVNDTSIKSLAQNLTNGETSVLNKTKAIYNYVVDNIEYDNAKQQARLMGENIGRYGAVKTLSLKRGVCEDISDLFVTLCRASGIPAFVVSGQTYSRDGIFSSVENGHAWTEVYIPRYGWLQVDPTWKLFGTFEGRHISVSLEKSSSEPHYVWWWTYQPFSYEEKDDLRLVSAAPPSHITLNTPTSNNMTTYSVALSWIASQDPNFARYEVYKSTTAGALGTLVTLITNNVTTAYNVTGLAPNTPYFFTIRVVNSAALFADSNQVTATTKAMPTAVTLNTPTQNQITPNSIALTWTVNKDPDFARYEIYMSTSAGTLGNLLTTIMNNATTTYAASGLTQRTNYFFTVRVVNNAGLSTDSNHITVTTGASTPTAVTLDTPSQNDITSNSVTLRWTTSQDKYFARYEIYMSTGPSALRNLVTSINSNTTTTYTVTNLVANTTNYFTVRIVNDVGLYADSGSVQASTLVPPLPFYMETWFISTGIIIVLVAIVAVVLMKKKSAA